MVLFLTTNMVTVTSCANEQWFATGWGWGEGGGGGREKWATHGNRPLALRGHVTNASFKQ